MVALLLAAAPAAAQMECEGQLIQVGDTTEQVLRLCGEPTRREVKNRGAPLNEYGAEWQETRTVEWTYDPGPGQFVRHLLFENGTLSQIREGGYRDLE